MKIFEVIDMKKKPYVKPKIQIEKIDIEAMLSIVLSAKSIIE